MTAPSPEEAHFDLVEAGAARTLLAARGRWPRVYLLVYSAGAVVTFWLVGLAGDYGVLVAAVIWPLLVVTMQRLSRHRPVTQRGGRRSLTIGAAAWGVLYATGLGLGFALFRDNAWYWVPVGILTGVPFVVMAARMGRSS